MRIIRGKYGRRRFDVPKNITARPTTDFARENLFNVLENLRDFDNKTALDLFAGTGAISFEFLSRECSAVTAVEQAATQVNFIRSVKEKLKDDALTIIRGDVFKFIATCHRRFDFIFADPPYAMENFDDLVAKIVTGDLANPGALIIIEHGKDRDFSALPNFKERRTYGSVNFSIFEIPE